VVGWADWDVQTVFCGEQLPFGRSVSGPMGGLVCSDSVLWWATAFWLVGQRSDGRIGKFRQCFVVSSCPLYKSQLYMSHYIAASSLLGTSWGETLLNRKCASEIKKVKVSLKRFGVARGFQDIWAPRFHDIRHVRVVRLSASRTGRLYPHKMFPVLIFTRVWVYARATVRSEGNMSLKIHIICAVLNMIPYLLDWAVKIL
jgi:hypothetical protein